MRRCVLGVWLVVIVLAAVLLLLAGAPVAAAAQQKWILAVGPQFQPSDVQAAGGQCEWYWKEAGIAVAVSADPKFGDLVIGKNVTIAFADVAAKLPARRWGTLLDTANNSPAFDAYEGNLQWYWQAIGASRPGEDLHTPVWQLGNYEGSGVKIGIIDTGAPAIWDSSDNPVGLHPEFDRYNPANPTNGGVVLLENPDTHAILNFDTWGHGTAVGSTIGARHRGEGAMRGLAPKATLYFHKIDVNNWISSALEGWYRAAEFGCQILNNSWFAWDLPVERYGDIVVKLPVIFRRAATELSRRGVLIVAAATNDAIDPQKDGATFYPWGDFGLDHGLSAVVLIPQDMPHVIVAGGTGPSDYDPFADDLTIYNPNPSSPSGRQKGRDFNLDRVVNENDYPQWFGWGSAYGPFLTVVAPMGSNTKTVSESDPLYLYQYMYLAAPWMYPGQVSPYHDWNAGTSFASPIACGAAALVAEAYNRAHGQMPSPTTLASILRASADDLVGPATEDLWTWNRKTLRFELILDAVGDKPGKDDRYGYGRVNIRRAIELARR
jgi:hypothetical protein